MQTLFYLGIIFLLGSLTQWLMSKLPVPKVVGYLVLGLLIGPEVFNIIPESFIQNSHFVIDMSLSLIAVMIGATLKFSQIKKVGRQVIFITLFEGTLAFIVVSIGFYLLSSHLNLSTEYALAISILFGGLAAATAPAATIAVIHELKAKGKFTTTLLGVVALDDAMALLLFALAITISDSIIGTGEFHLLAFVNSLTVISLSVVIGIIGAVISTFIDKLFSHHKGMETISTLGLIFIVYSLSLSWGLEAILSSLVMGLFMTNISEDFELIEEEIDNHLEEIIFMLFFILSAMHLKFEMIYTMPLVLLTYILLRMLGKVSGAYLGAKLSHADTKTQKYIGLALFPQAGLAIGLTLSLQNDAVFAPFAPFVLSVIISTTIIHELIGPLLTRHVLKRTHQY